MGVELKKVNPMKIGTVALVVCCPEKLKPPVLVAQLSDDHEIAALAAAVESGEVQPLEHVYQIRQKQEKEDEEFGNYIEKLLSQPFVRTEVQHHGVQWLKSKIKIEEFKKSEGEATRVIADYAFKLFQDHPDRTEFILSGPAAKVRIRVFLLPKEAASVTDRVA